MGHGPNQKEERSKRPIALRGHQDQRVDIEADSVSDTHWINPVTHLSLVQLMELVMIKKKMFSGVGFHVVCIL